MAAGSIPATLIEELTRFDDRWARLLREIGRRSPGADLTLCCRCEPHLLEPLRIGEGRRDAPSCSTCAGIDLLDDGPSHVRICFGPPEPDRSEAETSVRRTLAPVLGRLRLAARASLADLRARLAESRGADLLELRKKPTLALDAQARVHYRNRLAANLIAQRGLLRLDPAARLQLPTPKESEALYQKVTELANSAYWRSVERPVAWVHVELPKSHTHFAIRLDPWTSGLPDLPDPAPRRSFPNWVLATLHTSDDSLVLEDDGIAAAFGLTPSEAMLVRALVEGKQLITYAEAQGLKIATVRWHLHNVLQKLRCVSQADLIRMVLSHLG